MSTISLSTKTGNGKGLTLTNYNDGKIHGWNGGDCPVHPLTIVKLYFKRHTASNSEFVANVVSWLHHDESDDIVAFQVVKEYKEPMVVWMNMYGNGYAYTYKTKEEAMEYSGKGAKRIAVKLIEVQE